MVTMPEILFPLYSNSKLLSGSREDIDSYSTVEKLQTHANNYPAVRNKWSIPSCKCLHCLEGKWNTDLWMHFQEKKSLRVCQKCWFSVVANAAFILLISSSTSFPS